MSDHAAVTAYLNQYFPQFDQSLRDIIAERSVLRHFEAGEVMMHKGQYIRSVMLIAEGHVKLYRESEDDGSEFFVYYLEPGNACALSMVCAARQETSEVMARAIEATTVISIPISMMDDLMRQHRSWYYFVLETYRNRFEELLEVVDNIAFRSMDERLEFYLKKQVSELGSRQLRTTHQEIANDLNSSREVISRLLKKMEHQGKVQLNKNYIEWIA
ncbi:MAG: Crp/Fnr family transcriptional regulator [Chitinophagaceae bacterium]|uniref:Crp/Fnr family transcriptional regulator n=1 Tax=Rurimicrobium arvi TaxID=2049916 RepID=A0ABP8MRE6_9BACT